MRLCCTCDDFCTLVASAARGVHLLDLGLLFLVAKDAAIELLALLAQVLNACKPQDDIGLVAVCMGVGRSQHRSAREFGVEGYTR